MVHFSNRAKNHEGFATSSAKEKRRRLTLLMLHYNFQYIRRTEVWKISSKRVEKILRVILQESKREVPVPKLNLLGRYSVLAQLDENSCFTYSMEKVKVMEPLSFFGTQKSVIAWLHCPLSYTEPKEFYTDHPAKFQDAF